MFTRKIRTLGVQISITERGFLYRVRLLVVCKMDIAYHKKVLAVRMHELIGENYRIMNRNIDNARAVDRVKTNVCMRNAINNKSS